MAGYSFQHGMSNNAVDAYRNGVKPLTQITLADLRNAGWTETRALAVRMAKLDIWKPAEWHHSGGTWNNEVDFYDPRHAVEALEWLHENDREELFKPAKPVRVAHT